MPPRKELPKNVINPFSDAFLDKWQLWKDYRWEQHNFKYKGCISEQAALMKLNELSSGDEEKAWKIIKQSMEGPWKGFFPIHENNGKNGKSVTETREGVTSVLSGRNYERR